MFIESLFKFKDVEIEKHIDQHYTIKIPKKIFKEIDCKIKSIFWDNYATITLLQRTKTRKYIELVIIWRMEVFKENM